MSDRVCPRCGEGGLVLINTQNLKLCTNCFVGDGTPSEVGKPTRIEWKKDEGQPDYR